ncbi:hypothetical protein BMW24_004490 [Mycobacterium heckeshornense]|uniref:Uncharacterized protein n=1 Tax=Mycobacterium heckeshornense TaxID=110505 RepID=A0A2G8BH46_9MYCO|nr:hypothetical protein [Mycobacterium heckeshornense]KMV13672.1 hypothetical protein ACT16_23795 [Mycobacterium heckeshornense]MCV7034813.1 hypothetical protein [Mycobacterium heckeshornense]PIJ36956.1 hypothetical protein BMW24_004490 [Mycobacterium heckeshornense]BCO35264.1 hypothetical protein MHEC_16970 [Mycobacterium heckeshornense]BCO36722.1 hypothetical protein MHEC_31550 [Mycobacterium heckeshornense]
MPTLSYGNQAPITLTAAEATTVLDAMRAATADGGNQGSVVTVAGLTLLIGPSTPVAVTTT